MSDALVARAVALLKEGLERGDLAPLHRFLNDAARRSPGSASLVPLVIQAAEAERVRLIKLRTLGLTHGSAERLQRTEELIAALKSAPGGDTA